MTRYSIDVASHFRVLIADREQVFLARIKNILNIIGFKDIVAASDRLEYLNLMDKKNFDVALISIDPEFDGFWERANRLNTLTIGMTYDKNARTWISAIRRGADSVLLKQYHPHLLRPMLSQMVSSRRAWRGRLVQFPNTPSMRVLSESNGRAETVQSFGVGSPPNSSSGTT